MARKGQVSIQDSVETNEEFEQYLEQHDEQLICMEVYCEFCGPCLAASNAIRKGKLELGEDRIAMVKAMCDKIDVLQRFRHRSEPAFIFIYKGKLTRAMFGADSNELLNIIQDELNQMRFEVEQPTYVRPRPKLEIVEMLPEETVKLEEIQKVELEMFEDAERQRAMTVAARKKRVCYRMAVELKFFNYILFWPHCHQAHYDLYEYWDRINISVAAKETVQITDAAIKEAFYMSDVDPNEACVHALVSGEALVVMFKTSEDDPRDLVKLFRYALYEEIPKPKEDEPPEKQLPPIPAFERYASISKTAREVRRMRYEAKMEKLRQEQEERDRLAAEQARLAREAAEEAERLEKQRKEEEAFARIQAGLPAEPDEEPGVEEGEIEEEMEEGLQDEMKESEKDAGEAKPPGEEEEVAGEEEFHSDVEVEGEDYIPPGGLFVPGLYAPPNELAKANGLAFFFPKIVSQYTKIESENLPPHVLVMFSVDKRQELKELIKTFPDEIINMGFFLGDDPYSAEHLAFTIKHYDSLGRKIKHHDRFALMVSRKRSFPLLQLAGFNPLYISSSNEAGERDCLTLFPVGYGDEYQDEPSVTEEEIQAPPAEPAEEKREEE